MDDAISRLNSSWEEEATVLYEQLQEADRKRRAALSADLAQAVRRLDWSPGTDEPDETADPQAPGRAPPPVRPAGRFAQRAEEDYSLPRRTTHGGDFGPKVRAKLIAEIRRNSL